MKKEISELTVLYNDKTVGYLKQEDDTIAFQYAESWVKDGFSISPLSLPLSDKVYISSSAHFEGTYGVFYDSLPDGWGALLTSRSLQKIGVNYERLPVLTKLSLISKQGKGALEYRPSQMKEVHEIQYDLDEIAEQVRKIEENEDGDLDQIYNHAGSSGGARPKINYLYEGEEWIVKFPAVSDGKDAGYNEYLANQTAERSQINVNQYKLFPSERCKGYYGAKRFDRKKGRKVHMISLSALLETDYRIPNLDYMHLFQVIRKIGCDAGDISEGYRRMCFNVLYKNRDDHGKNFAFLYDEDRKGYVLSPFYDITETANKYEQEMTVLGNKNPTQEDLIRLAERIKMKPEEYRKIIEQVASSMQ